MELNREQDTKCIVCSRELGHMNLQRRIQHINRCSEKASENEKKLEKKDTETYFCPLCRKGFETITDRLLHLKQCGKKLPSTSLLAATELEDKHSNERKALGLPNVSELYSAVKVQTTTKGKSRVPKTLEPKTFGDAELQMALALSASLQPAGSIDTVVKGKPDKPRASKKNSAPKQTELLIQTEATRQLIMEQKLTELLMSGDELLFGQKKNDNTNCPLWEMASSSTVDRENFYITTELEGKVEPTHVEAGSKLRALSQVTGRNSILTQQEQSINCSFLELNKSANETYGGYCQESLRQVDNLVWNFSHLLFQDDLSDAVLLAECSRFPVHLAILSARTQLLVKAVLSSSSSFSNNICYEVEDITSEALGVFIRFIYTGQLLAGHDSDMLRLAQKYEMSDLLSILEKENQEDSELESEIENEDLMNEVLLTLSQCLDTQSDMLGSKACPSSLSSIKEINEEELTGKTSAKESSVTDNNLEFNENVEEVTGIPLNDSIGAEFTQSIKEKLNSGGCSPDIFDNSFSDNDEKCSTAGYNNSGTSMLIEKSGDKKRSLTDETATKPKRLRLSYSDSEEQKPVTNAAIPLPWIIPENEVLTQDSPHDYSLRLSSDDEKDNQDCEVPFLKSLKEDDVVCPRMEKVSLGSNWVPPDGSQSKTLENEVLESIETVFLDDDDDDSMSEANEVHIKRDPDNDQDVDWKDDHINDSFDWADSYVPMDLESVVLSDKTDQLEKTPKRSNSQSCSTSSTTELHTETGNIKDESIIKKRKCRDLFIDDFSSPELPPLSSRIGFSMTAPAVPKTTVTDKQTVINKPSIVDKRPAAEKTHRNKAPIINKPNVVDSPNCGDKEVPILTTPIRRPAKQNMGAVKKDLSVTPMPDYKAMITPYIKAALSRIGVRAMPKKRAVQLLQHIYEVTHPYASGSPSSNSPEPIQNTPDSESPDSSPGENVPEESYMEDSPTTMDSSVKGQIKKFIFEDVQLYQNILLYQPLPVEDLQKRLASVGIKTSLPRLMDFLDQECITFTLPRKERSGRKTKWTKLKKKSA